MNDAAPVYERLLKQRTGGVSVRRSTERRKGDGPGLVGRPFDRRDAQAHPARFVGFVGFASVASVARRTYSNPRGFCACQRQWSAHMRSMPYCASHPITSSALAGLAKHCATSPGRRATISYGTGLPDAFSNAFTTSITL